MSHGPLVLVALRTIPLYVYIYTYFSRFVSVHNDTVLFSSIAPGVRFYWLVQYAFSFMFKPAQDHNGLKFWTLL